MKLDALRSALEATGFSPVDAGDLAAVADKVLLCKKLLVSFEKQSAQQEGFCMEAEERLQQVHADHTAASIAVNRGVMRLCWECMSSLEVFTFGYRST